MSSRRSAAYACMHALQWGCPGQKLHSKNCYVAYSEICSVAKHADDIYCGGNTIVELQQNVKRLLQCFANSGLRLSATETTICPTSTTILGWIWNMGTIRASPHRIATLASCEAPTTVKAMRAFVGAYKMLARVIPGCSALLAPFDNATGGRQSSEHIVWTDSLRRPSSMHRTV